MNRALPMTSSDRFIFQHCYENAMKFSVILYGPPRGRDYWSGGAPPPYYPPPQYYPPYQMVNPYEAAYNSQEADKIARWIWYLVLVVVLIIVCGAIGFAMWISSMSIGAYFIPLPAAAMLTGHGPRHRRW